MSQLQELMNQLLSKPYTLRDFKKSAMQLVRKGADPAVMDTSKTYKGTLLHHLVRTNINGCNNNEIKELLNLPNIVSNFINIRDGFGCTPLQALMNQQIAGKCLPADYKQTAMLLVSLGANPRHKDTTKDTKGTLLHHLIRTNQNDINKKEIMSLCQVSKTLIEIKDGFGCTPLQLLINQLLNKKCSLEDFKKNAMLLANLRANTLVKDTSKHVKGTLLHHLIRTNQHAENNREIIELLSLNNKLVNALDGFDCTPLQSLMNQLISGKCPLENFKTSAMLLANLGADPEVTDTSTHKGTLLHHLVRTNNNGINEMEIIALLMLKNSLQNVRDGFGCTPLQALMNQLIAGLCTLDYFKQSAMILAKQDVDLEVKDTSTNIKGTLLHHLLRTNKHGDNDQEIADLLLLNKDLVNVRDGFGCTTLQTLMNQRVYKQCSLADFKKHAMIFAKLGADLSLQDTTLNTQGTLLHHLILTNVSACNEKEICRLLSFKKDIVNIKDGFGNTPLQVLMNQMHDKSCSLEDFKKTAMLLANKGANLNVKDTRDFKGTLLHLFISTNENNRNDKVIASLLALKKELVNIQDGYQRIPLQNLLRFNRNITIDVVENLLKSGSTMYSKDIYGETILHSCCTSGNFDVAKYLVFKGLHIDAQTNSGKTMLHCTVKHQNSSLWEWLYGNDINIDQVDNSGQTALHLAIINGNQAMVQWLIQNNANLELQDKNGNNALLLAEKCGQKIIASILLKAEPGINNFNPVSETNRRDPVLLHELKQVKAHIEIMLLKEHELKDNYADTPASIAAKLLCLRLNRYIDAYTTRQIPLNKFKTLSNWAFDKAHEELDKPRGYGVKQILANLAFAIATLGVGYLIASAYKGTFFPLTPNTASTNMINDVTATVNNLIVGN